MPDKPRIVNRLPKRIPSSERTAEIAPSTQSAEVAQTSQAITPALQELAVQAVGAVVQTPSSNPEQQGLTQEQQQREGALQAMVEARLTERAPSVGTLGNFGGVQVANQTKTREEATIKPDLTLQDLGVHYMAALRDMDTPEFQENVRRVAETRNLDSGDLARKVNDLVAIMAVPPPELLEATDFADSTLLVKITSAEREIVDRYASFKIAEQGYNPGLFAADPQTYAAFKARLTPEEQLAMQVTAEEGLGMWRAPARTPDSVANLVLAAPVNAPVEYLEVVHALVDEVTEKNASWKQKTEMNLEHAASTAVSKVANMMYANTYRFVDELKAKNRQPAMEKPPSWPKTVKDIKPPKKRPRWLGKEREEPLNPATERIAHATFGMRALENLKGGGSLSGKVKAYLEHQAFEGQYLVWDEQRNQLVSLGSTPVVERGDEKHAARVFQEVVIPLAFANGAGSEENIRSAQLHVSLGEKLRDMIGAHHEANPKVQAQQVERTIGVLGSPERPSDKQQLALAALKRGEQARKLTEAIEMDPELRARRGLSPQAPSLESRPSPNVLER